MRKVRMVIAKDCEASEEPIEMNVYRAKDLNLGDLSGIIVHISREAVEGIDQIGHPYKGTLLFIYGNDPKYFIKAGAIPINRHQDC